MNYQLTINEISKLFNSNTNSSEVITGISYDSRLVKEGDMFVCLTGEKTDGHDHINEAEKKGARAILAQKKISSNLPVIHVTDTQASISKLASHFYKEPSKKIRIIGVTGTNGKTTTTHLIQHILETCGHKTALIGTLGTKESTDSDYFDSKHTTPQASDLQRQLSSLVEKGFTKLSMEVSSHALALHRVDECNFSGVVLTNITQDHLDFHLTMEEYTKSKLKLFNMINESIMKNKFAIINKDDNSYDMFKNIVSKDVQTLSYSIKNKSDFYADKISFGSSGLTFKLSCPKGEYEIASKLN